MWGNGGFLLLKASSADCYRRMDIYQNNLETKFNRYLKTEMENETIYFELLRSEQLTSLEWQF